MPTQAYIHVHQINNYQTKHTSHTYTTGGHAHTCQVLIQNGFKGDDLKYGNQAIALAAAAGHTDTVQVLLQAPHDKKVPNKSGYNALHLAATG